MRGGHGPIIKTAHGGGGHLTVPLELRSCNYSFITPRACARGKAIGLSVCRRCRCRRCRHENRQISRSRRLCVL